MRYVCLFLLLLFLPACSSTQVIDKATPKPLGQEPQPVKAINIDWKVEDGNLVLSSTDGVKLNKQIKDTIVYIEQLQNLVCYENPKYSFCKGETNE